MDLQEFKKHNLKQQLGIDDAKFGKIFSFIDFGNVDNWFSEDTSWEGATIEEDNKILIDLEKLHAFSRCFSDQSRFYYGHDPKNIGSMKFLGKTKYIFGEKCVFTKPLQLIRHYLKNEEITTRNINEDRQGKYIYLPKCNFDVEICVDAIRLMNKYNTFCLYSSDADFISLIKFLNNNRKKIILIKGGYIQHQLKINSDLIVNAQDIKQHIAYLKQKSSH
jgi:uncharacterized LabA/DUF88 family protein